MPRKTISTQTNSEFTLDAHLHPDLLIDSGSKKAPRTRVRKKVPALVAKANSVPIQESDQESEETAVDEIQTPVSTTNNEITATFRKAVSQNVRKRVTFDPTITQPDPVAAKSESPTKTMDEDGVIAHFRTISQPQSNSEIILPATTSDVNLLSSFADPLLLSWRMKSNSGQSSTAGTLRNKARQQQPTQNRRNVSKGDQPEQTPKVQFNSDNIDIDFRFRSREDREKPSYSVAESPTALIPETPIISQPEKRPRISPPNDAPQIVMRNGIPTIAIDHQAIIPFGFAVGTLTGKTFDAAGEEIRLAHEAGVKLFQFDLSLETSESGVQNSLQEFLKATEKLTEWAPNCLYGIRMHLQPHRTWDTDFSEAKQTGPGHSLHPSICSDAFWNLASDSVAKFVESISKLPIAKNLISIHLGRDQWLRPESVGYDTSNAAKLKFKEWAKGRYMNDVVTLRAAWFDGKVNFDSIQIPDYEPHSDRIQQFVRSSRKDRKQVDYHLFLSDITVARISDLSYSIKKASEGKLMVGVSYGFSLELSYPFSGQLSLGKLLRDPHVDIVTGPPSYRNRMPGGAATFPSPIDSVALNGKLFMFEEDYKTSLSGRSDDDDLNPVLKTPQALESAQWRGVGAALAHGAGVMWCDTFSLGWLRTPGIWRRATLVIEKFFQRMSIEQKDPETIIFLDERALAYLVDPNAFVLMIQNVCEAAVRSGLHVGFYLLSDLAFRERFPEGKLYIFLNAWDVRTELRSAIKNRLQKDDKVLFWLYAAAMLDSGRESLERTREVMGIAIKPQPFHSKSGTTLVNKRNPLTSAFPDRGIIGGSKLEPSYFAIYDETQETLGQYSQTGLSSFVVKSHHSQENPADRWTTVFLGEPIVSPALIRNLGQLADVHVYDFHDDTVHVAPPFFTSHTRIGGSKTLPLPSNWTVYNALNQTFDSVDANSLRRIAFDSSTQMYYIGEREEIDGLIKTDPAEVCKIETYPEPDQNTIHDGAGELDVPLLRLVDWIGISEGEDNSDDWLLRPTVAEFEIDSADSGENEYQPPSNLRGVRRTRRDRKRRGHSVSETPDVVDADTGMSIMFRKRDE